jgi:hypothetical protein
MTSTLEEICDDVLEEENNEFTDDLNDFSDFIINSAKNYLTVFFHDKDMYCGGPISSNVLYSKMTLNTILNTTSEVGLKMAYKAMSKYGFKQGKILDKKRRDEEMEDVDFVLSIFKQCYNLGIPKYFNPGFLLVYLALCEGILYE